MNESNRPTGMAAFTVVWFGQVISLFGTAMTQFALTIWAWQITGSATALALVGTFTFAPSVLLAPIAGALVDRWNRKLVMMISDLAAGLSTVVILVLYVGGHLQIWHLYVAGAFTGAFQAFQWPAYSAAISTMMPKAQYARASGMMSLADFGSGILAPILAGLLIGLVGIGGIMTIDVMTFVFAVAALLLVHIPQPRLTEAGQAGRGNLLQESVYGLRYIYERPSLFGMQLVFLMGNLLSSFSWTMLAPMILARTNSNAALLGSVASSGALGGVAGGLILSAWGGPKRKVHGVLIGHAVAGLFFLLMGFGLPFWFVGWFCAALAIPIIDGSNQSLWQSKVPADLQGRVFSARRLIAQIGSPVSMIAAGWLADRWLEPGMMPGGGLAALFGRFVEPGPGAGMSLLFIAGGFLMLLLGLGGYAIPAVRNVESILPDHDAVPAASEAERNLLAADG